jgi:RNA polymerase sigma-70 factor (ECF subfamily)
MVQDPDPGQPQAAAESLDNTATLLARIRLGDDGARERLFARYLPILRRWAHYRLPRTSRDVRDTDDLVQDTLLRAFRRLDSFEHRGEGAFLAYLRQVMMNAVRDDLRRAGARPRQTTLDHWISDPAPSALEETMSRQWLAQFEAALAELDEEKRHAVILRVEFGFSHQQVAEALNKPSAEAARSVVARALATLAKTIGTRSERTPA